ncbi:MAG: phosphoribosylformylglycinamidine synthase subunit PurS [Candidatus Aenigmarchaeota archaeon]|nr:phosphoribosylformylglycinamidine synthase subunit PurS [Candidatus Aenigmarchaeota archaeon]OYT57902.1 MAG: phosphoribosylformylglycinamidine synthase PurS protein [Candidatus Aenigmarchaeota archaeon ex4484_14]
MIRVGLKDGITDPEGANVKKSLELLGFDNIVGVKTSKIFEITVEELDEEKAREEAENMCKKLLANPVIHSYEINIE